jgi:hypothetical protein
MIKRDPLRWRLTAALLATTLLVSVVVLRIAPPADVPRPLPPIQRDTAYLWQRSWSNAVRDAVAEPGPITELRVLALEIDEHGQMQRIQVDLAALANSPARSVPVVRIDGRQPPLSASALRRELQSLLDAWQAAGLHPKKIELDHDCARSSLAGYGNWIAQLRENWQDGPAIAITGLPDWLNSKDLGFLRATVDEFTLQVHAANDPATGLFDPQRALQWVDQLDRLSNAPYDVALPTYGARIRGQLHWARPEDIASVFAQWQRNQPRQLSGVKFFRLPVAGDGNTWSAATLAAVIKGEIPAPKLQLEQLQNVQGSIDLAVYNNTEFDAALPARVVIPAICDGDGAAGYRFQREVDRSLLESLEVDRLPPNRRRTLGWIRCPNPVEIRLESP